MKTFIGVLLVTACFVACTHSFPGMPFDSSDSDESDEKKNVDTVLVLSPDIRSRFVNPMLEFPDTSDFLDTAEDSKSSEFINSFVGNPLQRFITSMQSIMQRMREQMAGILSRIPEQGAVTWSKIPEGANTTSTTKIINGHVVTTNETTYMDGDDENGVLIRVRIVDIKPENDTSLPATTNASAEEVTTLPTVSTSAATTSNSAENTPSRSVETVEDFDNEIPKNQVDTLTA